MPLEHDAMCYKQSTQLTLLAEQIRVGTAIQTQIADRTQTLVDQYHTQNVRQAEMAGDIIHIRGKADEIERMLEKDYALRSEFQEIKSEWRRFLGLVLSAIVLAFVGYMVKGGLK